MLYILLVYVNPPGRWWGNELLPGFRWSLAAVIITFIALTIRRPQAGWSSILRQPFTWLFLAFIGWLTIQWTWALAPPLHEDRINYYLKFLVMLWMLYLCIDDEASLWRVLWAHYLGCLFLGFVVFTEHQGGRFDNFGGANLDDANAAAMTIATGLVAGAALFLAGNWRARLFLVLTGPFLANAIIASTSRSGFLALAVGSVAFAVLMPSKYRKAILPLGAVALAGFLWLTTDAYWGRIETVTYRGEQVEGLDTGYKRLVLAQAQLKMSERFPLGCGAFCTDVLSPQYLDEKQLNFGADGVGRRSSHNTYLTMLVDHGIPGFAAFTVLLFWVVKSIGSLHGYAKGHPDRSALAVAALGGGLAAIFVGDLFVQYPKLEVRFWYVAILLVLLRWRQLDYLGQSDSIGADPQVKPGGAGPGNGAADGRPLSPPARI